MPVRPGGIWVPNQELIINGNYDHHQRKVAGTQTHTTTFNIDTSFSADRMFTLPVGASVTSARDATHLPNSFAQYSELITGAASVTTVKHGQRVKSSIVLTRGKQPLLFQAWTLFTGSSGPFTPSLLVGTPGAVDDFTTVTNRLTQTLLSCATGVGTYHSFVFDPSAFTNVGNGLEIALQFPSGMLVASNTVNVAEFSVKPASGYPGFIAPDPDQVLSDAQQYYWKTFPQATAVAQNAGGVGAPMLVCTSTANGAIEMPVQFPRRMVKAPTLVAYDPYSTNANWGDGSSADSTKPATFLASSENGFTVWANAAGVSGGSFNIHVSANSELS